VIVMRCMNRFLRFQSSILDAPTILLGERQMQLDMMINFTAHTVA
jgi:hypothetical protein